ncbi:MAG TPA: peptide chain release factor N(5)-glutamine methyltransferase [Steroidobacteraceae bacterium]|nr:peptide chain release factor N(5)-glutamine methyltransferase [Steroidobacteraceae bacterium]
MTAQLTAGTLLAQATRRLAQALRSSAAATTGATPGLGPGTTAGATLDAQLLLAHALGVTRTRAMTHLERVPDTTEAQRYAGFIERRAAGEPLAYILGIKEFWSLSLKVGPEVLVPRPETELLVERALALRAESAGRVADLGTGSGAIALALALERPHWQVIATDVSADALATAKANAAALNLGRIEYLQGHWFAPLQGRSFHLIVSNPPYVAESDPAMQDPALRHEPRIALTPGRDPFSCLREIIRGAPEHLERDGWLLLEHGADQASGVARELVGRGFRSVRSHRDLAGHERVTEAQRM